MKRNSSTTQHDLTAAKAEFFKRGGTIKILPAQHEPRRSKVQLPESQTPYESFFDVLF